MLLIKWSIPKKDDLPCIKQSFITFQPSLLCSSDKARQCEHVSVALLEFICGGKTQC